jgi:hypothetical protein
MITDWLSFFIQRVATGPFKKEMNQGSKNSYILKKWPHVTWSHMNGQCNRHQAQFPQ